MTAMQKLRDHGLVALSFIAVCIASLIPLSHNATVILLAWLISMPLYTAYVVVTVGFLILPCTRLFPSVEGDLNRIGWWVLDVILCTLLLSQGLKFLVGLPRPSGSPSGTISGHTAFAFGLAWLILQTYPRLAPFWFATAIAIGWSRVQTETHYPYQVPVGAALGLLLGWAVTTLTGGLLFPRCVRWKRT